MRSASLLVLFVAIGWARPAAACSPPWCLPAAVLLDDGGASVPPNLAAVPLRLPSHRPSGVSFTVTARLLVEVGDGWVERPSELEGDVLSFPDGLAPGARHLVEIETRNTMPPDRLGRTCPDVVTETYELLALDTPAPDPGDTLGVLVPSNVREGPVPAFTSRGSCTEPVDARYVTIETALEPGLEPWSPVLLWQTQVDGVVYANHADPVSIHEYPDAYSYSPRGSTRGPGRDAIQVVCDPVPELVTATAVTPGTHLVRMSARLPGEAEPMWTDEIEVTIECPDPPRAAPQTPVQTVPAVGCAATPGGRSAWPLALAVGVALVVRRRRQRAQTPST